MNRPTFLLWLAVLLPYFSTAQNDSIPELLQTFPTKHELSAKVLGIDYGSPNEADLALTFGLEVAYRYRLIPQIAVAVPLKIGVANVVDDTENVNVTSLDGLLQLYPLGNNGKVQPYVMGGVGYTIERLENGHVQLPLGGGIDFRIGENSYVNIQGEYRVASADFRDNYQVGAGYVYQFSNTINVDADGDGVVDDADACPDTFGPRATQGCPDSDGDGVADKADVCPDIPGTLATSGCPDQDEDGVADQDDSCPEEAGPKATQGCPDQDEDGIADTEDDCPEEAGPKTTQGCPDTDGDGYANLVDPCPQLAGPAPQNGCPDTDGDGLIDPEDDCPTEAGLAANQGCPEEEPPLVEAPSITPAPTSDRDGDGVADDVDQCPDSVGPASTQGCPDRDGDGVPNHLDRCPDKAGPYTGCPDTDGDGIIDADDLCPEEAGLVTTKGCPEINQETRDVLDLAMRSVQFEPASANLKPESYPILNQIAKIMDRYPAYRLRISGHTDNIGDSEENQRLSEERAEACYQYLLAQGAVASRISYAGFGEDYPISSNRTASGRTLNRRVEFELIIQ